ncbi:MAG: hypothetical protein WBL39_04405 [Terrimicrobiaceae bacterium]
MTSPSKVLLLQHKAEPEDRIIRSFCLMPPDDDFLTLKLRFGKIHIPSHAGPSPDDDRGGLAINQVLRHVVSNSRSIYRPNSLARCWASSSMYAYQLAELLELFLGEGVAGEVALPESGHEPSVQQHV